MQPVGTRKFVCLIAAVILPLVFIVLQPQYACAQGIITTVAGNGRVFHGNGGPAASAALGLVGALAVDSAGNIFAADASNSIVVKITPGGVITVVAGNNVAGFSGDGGPATSASLNIWSGGGGAVVGGTAVDAAGNVYISDSNNNRIRKIGPDETITTVATMATGCGPAPDGLALDTGGNLYLTTCGQVKKMDPDGTMSTVAGGACCGYSGDGGPAINATFNQLRGIALDAAGNIYVADSGNNVVRKITSGGIISTVAGNGTFGYSGDGGPATSASLRNPYGVAVDGAGNIYIVDSFNSLIRKVTPGGIISTFAGGGYPLLGDGGPATQANLAQPASAAVAGGFVYIGDTLNGRIRRVGTNGIITTVAGIGITNYSGDGGPPKAAALSLPFHVVSDAAGNLYFSDSFNNRIRKVTPGGTITTVAGNGTAGFSGDGGPATLASLFQPKGVAVDAAGNLYIGDNRNGRVRKVTPAGTISTVAGNGNFAFSGDGGPATAAALAGPFGVAVDSGGNLYIADSGNNRIRKVIPNGTITTVAGSGPAPLGAGAGTFGGDGGPSTSASLRNPWGVAVDASGNLYIADAGNGRVREVTTNGVINTVAGGGNNFPAFGIPALSGGLAYVSSVALDSAGDLYIAESGQRILEVSPSGIMITVAGNGQATAFGGDGGPATSASLNSASGVAVDQAGNIYIADNGNDRIREVLAGAPSFSAAPSSLSFTGSSGAAVNIPQQVSVSSSVAGLAWSTAVSTNDGGKWLTISPSAGSTPGAMSVGVDATNLTPGTYQGTVTITAPNAIPSMQTVTVTFNVTPPNPPQLAVALNGLSFFFGQQASAGSAQINVSNQGGGSLNFTSSVTTNSGGGWLSVTPASGTLTALASVPLTVTANQAGLTPGTYTGGLSISSQATGQTINLPVNMTVSGISQTILLSQAGLTFSAVAAGGAPPPQTFGILNTGQGVMNWSAGASTLSGGANWLTVTPSSGSSDAASLTVPLVTVGVNAAGLSPGDYYGQVHVSAGGASNSPQIALVVLHVLPTGSTPPPVVRPTGLIFTGVAGGTSPGSQNVSVANLTGKATSFSSGRLTLDGANWFVNQPTNDNVPPNQPSQIVVQPSLTGLNAGIRHGVLTLLFNDGTAQTVNLLFVLVGSGVQPQGLRSAAGGCAPTKLLPIFTSLNANFSVPTGWPNPIEVRVVDDCGNPMATGSVLASFSNGDPPVVLAPLGNGIWSGTWQPRNSTQGQVTVTVAAKIPAQGIQGTAQATGGVQAGGNVPVLGQGGVVNAASFAPQAPVAPGGLISIFGSKLSASQSSAPTLPLQTQLASTQVSIAGQAMPLLYASDGQINAVVPYGISVNTSYQVQVQNGTSASVPVPVTVAAAQPAVFTQDQSGKGQGLIFDGASLAGPSAPAKAGDALVIYCSGLGAVNPPVAAGTASPSSPLSTTVNPVSVTIGGAQAQVLFAGLAPGFAGLYQVNVVVPNGVNAGSAVPVTLTVAGQTSPPVTMALQ